MPHNHIREKKKIEYIKLWIKVRIYYLLAFGRCWRCKGKLHLNQLGFYNCGKCFTEYMAKELGEDPKDWDY